MPHNHRDRCWRASVLLKCPGARNFQKHVFGLIAQFDLPGLKKRGATFGGMEEKSEKNSFSNRIKFVLGRETGGFLGATAATD